MFLVPANFHQFYSTNESNNQRLLCWDVVKTKMSWGVIILLGGGFALAYGTEVFQNDDGSIFFYFVNHFILNLYRNLDYLVGLASN